MTFSTSARGGLLLKRFVSLACEARQFVSGEWTGMGLGDAAALPLQHLTGPRFGSMTRDLL